jgi:carbon storage regulator
MMLVLSRRESQRIKLGTSIIVTVVRVTGEKVRLGIEAPPDVLILRDELDPHPPSEELDGEETLAADNLDPLQVAVARSA